MGKKKEQSGIREDKLGRDANKPEICLKNRTIHKVTWID